jgi:hypothetical protein
MFRFTPTLAIEQHRAVVDGRHVIYDLHKFDFDYGDEFAKSIEADKPTFAKILLSYDPEDDAVLNQRQTRRLKQLSDYCRAIGQPFMFELRVPAMKSQSDCVRADERVDDRRIRPHFAVEAVCVIEDANEVVPWLKTAAAVPAFVGFAVERTAFWDTVTDFMEAGVARAEAGTGIRGWVAVSEPVTNMATMPLPHPVPRHITDASLTPARVPSLPLHSARPGATTTLPARAHDLSPDSSGVRPVLTRKRQLHGVRRGDPSVV